MFLLPEIRVDNPLIATLYIPKKIYELIVMTFRLTNIAVIFHDIVNNLLRNLINSSSIAFYIDDVLVAILLYINSTHSEDMSL